LPGNDLFTYSGREAITGHFCKAAISKEMSVKLIFHPVIDSTLFEITEKKKVFRSKNARKRKMTERFQATSDK